MNIHKNTRLLPYQREAIWQAYHTDKENVTSLALRYGVSRPTIYKVLKLARIRLLKPQNSTNNRFKQARFGIKRLAKVEKSIQDKLKKQARRYNKSYPGEMVHVDTKRLPLLKGQSTQSPREYLFVAIDDYSRELYATIMPDKTACSATKFLIEHVIKPCPYVIDVIYSDNGTEYKGTKDHEFVKACYQNNINQKFTKVGRPQTNGKAERVIRTLLQMWHDKHEFIDNQHRQQELNRFINFYNTV
ncbi:DDE-type integrase/transposase/recombinase [Moraxella nasovis]|nr:DDE-type integrase/transposase/recombinase [Moraxella nasovis]UNU73609.1 DDE-type integrase/transposase/recombinase [Moraxella nasovis]